MLCRILTHKSVSRGVLPCPSRVFVSILLLLLRILSPVLSVLLSFLASSYSLVSRLLCSVFSKLRYCIYEVMTFKKIAPGYRGIYCTAEWGRWISFFSYHPRVLLLYHFSSNLQQNIVSTTNATYSLFLPLSSHSST